LGRRSITGQEIALIKAMLARGLKNKDIQFFFNRPDRSVNSGRISTIRKGTYSNSAEIAAASNADLDSFVSSFAPTTIGVAIVGSSSPPPSADPVRTLFAKNAAGQ
jgi:hypothetical protein